MTIKTLARHERNRNGSASSLRSRSGCFGGVGSRPLHVGAALAALLWTSGTGIGRAEDKLRVACTLPTLEALAKEVGGHKVETFSLAKGDQDPHFVSPTPILMSKVRKADLLLEIGMQLELWADNVADGSGNRRIFKGGEGRVVVSTGIPKLEIPTAITRAQGDVHPEGNPHLWLDPGRAGLIARNIAEAFVRVRPQDEAYFRSQLESFEHRLDAALTAWKQRAAPLKGIRAVEYHKVWAYFAEAFGLNLVGVIEPYPGIPPGPQQLTRIIDQVRSQGVRMIVMDNFYGSKAPSAIAERTGAHLVILPNQVGGEPEIRSYFDLIDHVLSALLKNVTGT